MNHILVGLVGVFSCIGVFVLLFRRTKRFLRIKSLKNSIMDGDKNGKNCFLCLYIKHGKCFLVQTNREQSLKSCPVKRMWFNNARSAAAYRITLEQRFSDIMGYEVQQQPVSDNSTNVVELSNYAATCSSEEDKYSHIPNWRMRMFDQI